MMRSSHVQAREKKRRRVREAELEKKSLMEVRHLERGSKVLLWS